MLCQHHSQCWLRNMIRLAKHWLIDVRTMHYVQRHRSIASASLAGKSVRRQINKCRPTPSTRSDGALTLTDAASSDGRTELLCSGTCLVALFPNLRFEGGSVAEGGRAAEEGRDHRESSSPRARSSSLPPSETVTKTIDHDTPTGQTDQTD